MARASVGLVAVMVGLVVVLIVGLVVTAQLYNVANNLNLGTQGNQTRTTLFNNVYSSFTLAAIIPIVAVATIIIAYLKF